MWCYERKKKKEKEESRNQNSPKAFGELKNPDQTILCTQIMPEYVRAKMGRSRSRLQQCSSIQYKLVQCKQSSALLMTSAAKRTIDYSFTLWRRVQQSTEEPSVYSYSISTYGTYHQESKLRLHNSFDSFFFLYRLST